MRHRFSRWRPRRLGVLCALAALLALDRPDAAQAQSWTPRQSSPIALSNDDYFLVNVNPEANTVTVYETYSAAAPTKLAEIAVGREPSSVAIHPAWYSAYVANTLDGTITVVDPTTLTVLSTFAVGAEPMAVALAPNGTRLYVACAASNTLVVVNTATEKVEATIDLSPYGNSPRAIAVTNDYDTDDTNEIVFVAMFFGALRPGRTANDEGLDDQREGRVVAISAATNTPLGAPNPITLGPVANTGFNANGRLAPAPGQVPAVAATNPQTFTAPTGAYVNQLAAIGIRPYYNTAYVVSTGASPNGPIRFNVMNQGLVSVYDGATRQEIIAGQTDPTVRQTAPLNLNQGINLDTTAPRLFLSNPVAISWRIDASDAWVVVQNTNVVVRMTVDAGGVPTIGAPLAAGPGQVVRVDLQDVTPGLIAGKAPRGIAVSQFTNYAYVYNFVSRSVTAINIATPTAPYIAGTTRATALPIRGSVDEKILLGAELFHTGRGPQERMSSESWGGCITCHPNGRSDNVTWMFDAGPRQTIPLDGMFSKLNPADQRILNWSAVRDENHDFELNTRGVFGGRGLIDNDRTFFVFGGASGAGPADSGLIEQFHQVTGLVTLTNDLSKGAALPNFNFNTPRRDFAVATLADDRVFLIGGRWGGGQGALVGAANAVLEFNPRTNQVRTRSSVGFTPRHSLGAAVVRTALGSRIYAVGGYTATAAGTAPSALVEEYNPATNTWRTVASLPTAVAQFGITVAGGVNTAEPSQLIHVVSGNTGSESVPSVANPNPVQRFQADPSGPGVWSTFNPAGLTLRRNHAAATALRGVSSRVFVLGGQNAGGTVLDTVEEYQAQAVTVVATPHTSMPAARARFGISQSLSTNQIYVIGGVNGAGADQNTVFEYTLAANGAVPGPAGTPSGTWATRPGTLSTARRGLGVATPPGVTNFLTARSSGRDARQDAIAMWLARKVRAGRAPVEQLDPAAVRGRQLFGEVGLVQTGFSCATCHGGAKWTRSTVDYPAPPSPDTGLGLGNQRVIGAELRQTLTQGPNVLINVGTFTLGGGRINEIRTNPADASATINPLGAAGFNIPSLLSVYETAPYFYSGLAQTLEEVLNGSQDTLGGVQHHFVQDPKHREELLAFLRSIDDTTPIFP